MKVQDLSNSDLATSLRAMRITGIAPSRTEAEMLDEAADRIEILDRVYKWIEGKEHEMSDHGERSDYEYDEVPEDEEILSDRP